MSVESVGLELPSIFSVSGSPVTTTGTLAGDLVTQPANSVFAGPISGADDVPAFRTLSESDLPIATTISLGAVSIGSGLTVTGGGALSADAPAIATTSSVGVISAGTGLSVNGSGVLSANAPAVATTGSVGVVSIGSGLSVTPAGVLSRSNAFSVGVPALSAFTKVNQGSCTVSETPGQSITVTGTGSPANTWNNFVMYAAAPTAPYRLAAFLSISSSSYGYLGGGLGFYDPSSTKFIEVFICWNINNVCQIQISSWNSPTSFSASPVVWPWSMNTAGFWLGLRDDGTNVYYEMSADGANFVPLYQEAKSSGFLSSYGNVALITNLSRATSARKINSTLFVWDVNGLSRTPTIL